MFDKRFSAFEHMAPLLLTAGLHKWHTACLVSAVTRKYPVPPSVAGLGGHRKRELFSGSRYLTGALGQ